uniref:STI1 domain-containing protein n=1 Tax=Spongospora subterranea TaxID=70186 RepID=A0A0H5R5J9_9EUKA|eukprot:CRZ09052.1 hypothetical protein [Spongospora subterranea]
MTTGDLSTDQRDLIVSICKFLHGLESSKAVDADSVEVAVQCITEATGVQIDQPSTRSLPPLLDIFRTGLSVINSQNGHPDGFDKFVKALKDKGFFEGFDEGSSEYSVRLNRAKEKFNDKYGQSAATVTTKQVEQSEVLKAEGNRALSDGDTQGAIELYSQAITFNPTNAILFGNRAAAHSKLGNYQDAVKDCQRAVELDYSYTKAHYRLGVAYSQLNETKKAKESFTAALSTCSDSSCALASEIQDALSAIDGKPATSEGASPFDLGALFNNPMVQQMMQDPDLLRGMMGGLNPASSPSASPTSAPFNPMSLLTDPSALKTFLDSPSVQAHSQDPELGPVIADLRMNGSSALMKHIGNPAVMSKLANMLKKK